MADAHHRLTPVTVLFADISASTALYVERGDATAFALTADCLAIAEAHVRASDGRVRKRLGDGILATFAHPDAALAAARATISELVNPSATLLRQGVRIRFGLSHGPAVDAADDVFGDAVNVGARLLALAGADEIFLSGTVYEMLSPPLRAGARLIDSINLRNRPGAVLVYEYVGEESDATVSIGRRPRTATATLEIHHGDRVFVVGPERARLTIGRRAEHDIRLEHEGISRVHAEVMLRDDRFVLVDRSTNGTYIYLDGGPVLRVLREELVLSGSGRIVAGVDLDPPIRFRIATGASPA